MDFDEIRNLHDIRYDVRAVINRGLRNRVIYVRKSWSEDSCPSRIFVLVDILDEIPKQCQPEILVIADVGEDPGS